MRERPHQYIAGDHLMACDECGGVFLRSELRERWDHAWVCGNDWEARHPQEEVRATRDKIRVDVSRPEGAIAYVVSSTEFPDMSVTTIAALMQAGGGLQAIYVQGRTVPGDGGQGIFRGTNDDISAQVATDPLRGIYIPNSIDLSGASGGWIRQDITPARPEWWGGGSNLNSGDAINYASYFGYHVYLAGNDYLIDKQLTGRSYHLFQGANRGITRLVKTFNGDMFDSFATGMGITNISLIGDGGNYTGRALPITGTTGQQHMDNFAITGFDGYCIEFEVAAGSQSTFSNGIISRYDGLTAGRYSVKISDTQQLSAKPRKFSNIETDGTLFIDFGGCNNTFVQGAWSGGYKYTTDTRAAIIADGRIGNILSMDIDGHNNVISGCDISPDLVILSGADGNTLQGNTYNGTITDNSGNGRNLIDYLSIAYTPTWTAATSNPDLGNGTLTGEQSRSGDKITVSIELTVGSTTTFGSGTWRFSLPKTPLPNNGDPQYFPAWLTDSGTTQTVGMVRLLNNQAYLEISVPGGLTFVNATTPWTWAVGDTIRVTFAYIL